MASKSQKIVHTFGGGLATDFGTAFIGAPSGGSMVLPWLNTAENLTFEYDGGPRKIAGIDKVNASALESGAAIKGLFDWWKIGSLGAAEQHRVIHIGTKIKKDDGDGNFTDLFTGLVSGALPCYAVLEDLLVMCSDGGDVPKSWNGTTAQNLAGSPPNFSMCVSHKNRMFAAGVNANPSRLYYSVSLNAADWTGGGSGTIDIDPSDGDRITAIVPHKDELFVFKGPYKGSIHRITGSSSSDFARVQFGRGASVVSHRMAFAFGDDLGFMAPDGTIYTLSATQAYGDYRRTSLSFPLQSYLSERLNFGRLAHGQAVNWPEKGQVWFTLPIYSANDPNHILIMDYRFETPRFSTASAFDMMTSLAISVDATSSNRRVMMAGCDDGYVRKAGRVLRAIDGTTTYTMRFVPPTLNYGLNLTNKVMRTFGIGIRPRNAASFLVTLNLDRNPPITESMVQTGGAAVDSFILDIDRLGGADQSDNFLEGDFGEFSALSMEIQQPGLFDLECHSLSTVVDVSADNYEVR